MTENLRMVEISSKNQITLPEAMMQKLGLKKGCNVILLCGEENLIIQKAALDPERKSRLGWRKK